MTDEIERAERFSGRRSKLAVVFTMTFMVWGLYWWLTFDWVTTDGSHLPRVGNALAWAAWGAAVLALTFGPGGWRWTRRQRSILNDERTRAHQAVAARAGFAVAVLGLAVLCALMLARATDPLAGVALVLSLAVIAPALTFAWLQHRDG